jgi:hypothetical protein
MPRQLQISKLKNQINKKQSPAKTTDRAIYSAGCKQRGGVGFSQVGNIKTVSNKLSRNGALQELDKSIQPKNEALALLSSLGIGIVDSNSANSTEALGVIKQGASQKMNTSFSLLQKDTDQTIIPNKDVFDFKSISKEEVGPELILTTDKFLNPAENPFYAPDEQMPDTARAKKHKEQFKNKPNVINITADIVKLQSGLPTRLMLPELRRAMGKET